MTRIVLGIEYDGSRYSGWQSQHHLRTIQEELEKALSIVADQPVSVVCAGRTDAGVHAYEQVIHFDTGVDRAMHSWLLGGNSHLPNDIRILWANPANSDFHARYSAIARYYRYIIMNRPVRSALTPTQSTWCFARLSEGCMHQAAQYLVGHHDFSSFRAQGCQSKSPFRQIHFVKVSRERDLVYIDIIANAFLHHMVRNIAGTLIAIGTGKRSIDWINELLEVKSRKRGGVTASANGLHLAGVYYPEQYGLSSHPIFKNLPKDAKRHDSSDCT
jgi:tRNA pseudouridine38-40 synthase